MARGPKTYRSIEEFEREEIRPSTKIGFSLDDIYQDWAVHGCEEVVDESAELDFDR